MKVLSTEIPDLKIIEPVVFNDARGYFIESFSQRWFNQNVADINFVQDNESMSTYGVLRGLHYQLQPYAQAKLVRVVHGEVFDVAVDIRKNSPTFGKYVAVLLSDQNKRQFFIPHGFAHGFLVLTPYAVFSYKMDNYYAPQHEAGILFSDPTLNINWQIPLSSMIISDKDQKQPLLNNAKLFN